MPKFIYLVNGYDIGRSDKSKRLDGGVLLYSHNNILISFTAQHDDSICQALFCKFDTIKKSVLLWFTDLPMRNTKVSSKLFNSFRNKLSLLMMIASLFV